MTESSGRRLRRPLIAVATAVLAFFLFVVTALPAWGLTVAFVRHGESYGNAGDAIDTSIPGPELTPEGWAQALGVQARLAGYGFTHVPMEPERLRGR